MKNILLANLFIFLLSSTTYAADEETPNSDAQNEASESTQSSQTDGASDADDTAPARFVPNPRQQQQRDIAALLEGSLTEVVELEALDEKFDLYYLQADQKEVLGSILFFPDQRTHSDWPISLSPLRVGLTHYKWQTAVLTLPANNLPKIPQRSVDEPATEQAQAPDEAQAGEPDPQDTPETQAAAQTATQGTQSTENSVQDPQDPATAAKSNSEITMARATAAVQMLKEKSDILILIGIGQGATWATDFALTLTDADKENTRLVIVNPIQSPDVTAKVLNDMIIDLKIDTFDVYSAHEKNNKGIDQALARKRAANQSDIENYLQVKSPSSSWSKRGNDWLYRKVLGIIKTKVAAQIEEMNMQKKQPKAPAKTNQMPGA